MIDRIAKLLARAATKAPARRILVLDADTEAARELVQLLRKMGHEVREARDAAEALRGRTASSRSSSSHAPPPRLDVSAFAERLAARRAYVPIFVGLVDDGAELSEQGFDLHLARPLDPDASIALLRFAEEIVSESEAGEPRIEP